MSCINWILNSLDMTQETVFAKMKHALNDVIMILDVMDNFADFFPIQQKLHLKQAIVPLIAAFVIGTVYFMCIKLIFVEKKYCFMPRLVLLTVVL